MPLIKELLDLPPQVSKDDFLLNLAAGVSQSNAAATLRFAEAGAGCRVFGGREA